jgi:methylase of polypeptide subunit release factors
VDQGTTGSPDGEDAALLALLYGLGRAGYRFVTPTPVTHQRNLARRAGASAAGLTDVFGWNLPFASGVLDAELEAALRTGGMLEAAPPLLRSGVRVSSVMGRLYLHSAFPTEAGDAVFLGPDSYRFANLIADELAARPVPHGGRIADIGAGAGVGAITAACRSPDAAIVATDINPKALRLTRVNAAAAGVCVETVATSGLDGAPGRFDLVLLNPPYMMDEGGRAYRDGGDMHGGRLSLDLTTAALPRLEANGRLILYTGSAIVAGEDRLGAALGKAAQAHGCSLRYREIDPDVFGEDLDKPQYAEVDRIAVVSAVFTGNAGPEPVAP